MRRQTELLWHLRVYGPCSVAKLIETTTWPRQTLVSTMRRLRDIGHAEKLGDNAMYRITPGGQRLLDACATPIIAANPGGPGQ
jgi:hypothetical protein